MKPVPCFINMDGQTFGSSAASVFQKFGEKLSYYIFLEFPTTYFLEQGVSQVLHMHNKCRYHLDMNKTEGNAIRLRLTSLQPTFKKLTDKKPGPRFAEVGTNCFLEMSNIFSGNAIAFVLFVRFFVLTRLPVFFQNTMIFWTTLKSWVDFIAKFLSGSDWTKKVEDHWIITITPIYHCIVPAWNKQGKTSHFSWIGLPVSLTYSNHQIFWWHWPHHKGNEVAGLGWHLDESQWIPHLVHQTFGKKYWQLRTQHSFKQSNKHWNIVQEILFNVYAFKSKYTKLKLGQFPHSLSHHLYQHAILVLFIILLFWQHAIKVFRN